MAQDHSFDVVSKVNVQELRLSYRVRHPVDMQVQ